MGRGLNGKLGYASAAIKLFGSINHGPFPCGHWPDLKIFCHAMISYLDDGEKAEADDAYLGEPTKTLIPKVNTITPPNPEL